MQQRSNRSIERIHSGLRPPWVAHVKRQEFFSKAQSMANKLVVLKLVGLRRCGESEYLEGV